MNKGFINQINESVGLVEASTPKWLLRMVKNPKTGNMVQVRSLPPEEQEKYRPKKSANPLTAAARELRKSKMSMNRAINTSDDDPNDKKKEARANEKIKAHNTAVEKYNKAHDDHVAGLKSQIADLKGKIKPDKKQVKALAKEHGLGRWSVRGNELLNKDTGEKHSVGPGDDLLSVMKGKAKPAEKSNVIPFKKKEEPKATEPVNPSEDLWRETGLNAIRGRSYSSFGFGPSRSPEKWHFDGDTAELELDRYRRHDHGGGSNGDDWLPDHEVERDRAEGMKTYGYLEKEIKAKLNKAGYDGDVDFDLGEKGHFRVMVFNLRKEKR